MISELEKGNSEVRNSKSIEGKDVKPGFFDKMNYNISGERSTESIGNKDYKHINDSRVVKENVDKSPIQNKIDGCRRENEVEQELIEKYPESEGYSIVKEGYLRDRDGNVVKDEKTGGARRIDFVVIKDGKVVDAVEVTSTTADKVGQTAKEYRIREAGGNYIKDNDGNLVRMPNNVETRIERRD